MLTVQNRINGFPIITDIGAFLNRVNCTTGPGVSTVLQAPGCQLYYRPRGVNCSTGPGVSTVLQAPGCQLYYRPRGVNCTTGPGVSTVLQAPGYTSLYVQPLLSNKDLCTVHNYYKPCLTSTH